MPSPRGLVQDVLSSRCTGADGTLSSWGGGSGALTCRALSTFCPAVSLGSPMHRLGPQKIAWVVSIFNLFDRQSSHHWLTPQMPAAVELGDPRKPGGAWGAGQGSEGWKLAGLEAWRQDAHLSPRVPGAPPESQALGEAPGAQAVEGRGGGQRGESPVRGAWGGGRPWALEAGVTPVLVRVGRGCWACGPPPLDRLD